MPVAEPGSGPRLLGVFRRQAGKPTGWRGADGRTIGERTVNFGFSEEQQLLRAEVRRFLDQNASLERVREMTEAGGGMDPQLWMRIAELGWVGLAMPEQHGGVGLGLETLIVVLEETEPSGLVG